MSLSQRLRPVGLLDEEVDDALAGCRRALQSGVLSCGPIVEEFERAFAASHGVRHAVAVSSGTDALECILRALDVSGHEVLVPTNTFAATAFAVCRAGGIPVFVDMDPQTLAPGLDDLEAGLSERVKAIVVVHIGGYITPAMAEVARWARLRGVALVEDASHAHGAQYDGQSAGAWGIAAAFSMYATKVMTSGEGGVIATNSDQISEESLVYRDQGKALDDANRHVRLGGNARLSELNAALGVATLKRLTLHVALRKQIAQRYAQLLGDDARMTAFAPDSRCQPSYYKYVVQLPAGTDRERLHESMRRRGTPLAGEVYRVPLHRQPVFAGKVRLAGGLANADMFCARHIALPISPRMRPADADLVVANLVDALDEEAENGVVACASR
jgi:dTDP-4-amino-4,6-dideoxygalactose transaminase